MRKCRIECVVVNYYVLSVLNKSFLIAFIDISLSGKLATSMQIPATMSQIVYIYMAAVLSNMIS